MERTLIAETSPVEGQIALANAGCCPFCGGENPEYDAMDATHKIQAASCPTCGIRWEEGLSTTSIWKIEEGE